MHFLPLSLVTGAVLVSLGVIEAIAGQSPTTTSLPSLSGKHGGVATEVGECSSIGVDIMKAGGNAADAILASALCVGTIAAYHSGIGGGGFMLIDFREMAPAAANETMLTSSTNPGASSVFGGLAIGVPGEFRGWEMLHKRHGRLPWHTIFAPAIKLARHGFPLNADLEYFVNMGQDFILKDPLWAERYVDALEHIANNGPNTFYKGRIATNIAEAVFAQGGVLTTRDLENYSAVIRKPVNITYRNHRIFSTVAPSSGAVVLSALKIFEGYRGNYTDSDPEINVTTHRLIEATQFAYGQRTQYGDPAFVTNVQDLQQYYLADEVVAVSQSCEAKSKIMPRSRCRTYYDPANYTILDDHGTSHMAAIDESGMAVSLTTTINLYWGSQVMTADGIVLNNQMDDFSSPGQTNAFGFAPSPSNFIRPGKRPQSSISSSIAEDLVTGEITIATGSAGGSRIITATLQELYHYIDQGLSPAECTGHARWHDQLSGVTYFETGSDALGIKGFDNGTIAYLRSLGYNTTAQDLIGSTSHVVARAKNGTITAASDPRKVAACGAAY
ncbi:gamma-glutamyltranspeptidase [Mycena metata]|uniref:Glutathione hydrolase n=1 Tax=Mycena metata TaxID=1033252 RepID=A0AAD7MN30_9AGAR|nr:gamma-glutamyltranspeptidase [Mycena metata]